MAHRDLHHTFASAEQKRDAIVGVLSLLVRSSHVAGRLRGARTRMRERERRDVMFGDPLAGRRPR
jgi:hypothetical protein